MKINLNKLFELAATRELVLGRDCAEFELLHPTVSRRHAVLRKVSDQEFTITDLDSVNGVKVNGVRVKSAKLSSGDSIELGEVRLEIEAKNCDVIHSLSDWIESSIRLKKYFGW